MPLKITIDDILARPAPPTEGGEVIGSSREGRDIVAYQLGRGPFHVSLIGGCHADEPVGPTMLEHLAGYLAGLPPKAPLISRIRWWIVPRTNPDGDEVNSPWSRILADLDDGRSAYDLSLYLRHVAREPPGDDVEFGFPRSSGDAGARPENRAVAAFLRRGAPYILHASFHGMAFAAGPWFLMEASWAERTLEMRQRLRQRTADLGYRVHDIDRGGEKGFTRIDEGFTTRPDSRAMAAYFRSRGEEKTAELFRPSSMEFVRSLGGDPLTLVSEMPLFLLPPEHYQGGDVVRPEALANLRSLTDPEELRREAERIGIAPMPIEDQMHLQLAFLEEGLAAALYE